MISLYATSVHLKMNNPNYEAMCDIGKRVSCTAVFKTEYAYMLSHLGVVPKGYRLDISNGTAGLLMYTLYFLFSVCLWNSMSESLRSKILLGAAVTGSAFSIYLIYVLSFVLGDFCLVCYGIHTINFCLLVVAYFEY